MKMLRTLALGALLAGTLVAACRDGGPTAGPRTDTLQSATTTINDVRLVLSPPSHRLTPAATATAVIGPEGGSIAVDGAELIVPPGALDQPVEFSARGPLDPLYAYRFGPNGLQFNVPATLSIRVDSVPAGLEPTRLRIAVASDEGSDWKIIGGVYNPVTQTVTTKIEHFTQYALCEN